MTGDVEIIGGRYEVVAHLGAGGMGSVYLTTDRSTGKAVALKRILKAEAARSSKAIVRFQNEFHSIARLRHPHIVQVFDYGVDPEGPYYTMEVLDGKDLRDMERPSPIEACGILRDVAVALSFLHSRSLLHRDLAPRNVRCMANGRAKLIDFGLLATFGSSEEIAGTPPLVPPEMVRGLPMDHRADLYGLGGLAYWLLTGRYAYSVRSISELELAWRTRPPALSSLVPEVPLALEELVTSLLCLDPLGRPRSAAEVADRLSAIGRLEPPDVDVTGGYLASAALVGRGREMEQMRRRIRCAVGGEGSLVVIKAPSGVGKSRLLRESLFEAQLAGATVVSASSDSANHGPYGLFRELARGLLASAREETVEAARADAAVLAAVIPELRELLRAELMSAVAETTGEPAEERLRAQAAINQWVLRIAARRPLAILIDDIQRCDEASLAVVVGLAYSIAAHPIVLALALRSDEPARFPELLGPLLSAGMSIKLRGLALVETEAFVAALFGDVPRVGALAKWMYQATGGSPLHLTELAHYVVATGIVSFHEGMWVLPTQSADIELPAGLTGAMDARIALLPCNARAFAEALSMHGGQLDLDLSIELADSSDAQQVFPLLDELMEQQILVGSREQFRFRHDGLREALLRGMPAEREESLHLRVAMVLDQREGVGVDREAEIGWHFLLGGNHARGATFLEQAGRRLFEAQAMRDAIAPIEAAIQNYKDGRIKSHAYFELLYMIVMAGAISDRKVALRYMDETLIAYQKRSGIALATFLGRIVGRHIALFVGVLTSVVRWVFTPRRSRPQSPLYTLTRFLMMTAHAAYIRYASNDVQGLRKTLEWIAPINAFKGRAPHGAYESQHGMLDLMQGRFAKGVARFRYGVHVVLTDKITPTSDFERRYIEAAGRGFIVIGGVMQLDAGIDEELDRIQELDLRYFGFCARAGVALRHRLRGEEEQARDVVRELEVVGMQLGAGWHIEALLLVVSSYAYALSRDVLGLKRCAEELHRLNEAGLYFTAQLQLVRGEYHRVRGDFDLATKALDAALEEIDADEITVYQWALAAKADVCLAQGDYEQARDCIQRVLTACEGCEGPQLLPRLRATLTWALVQAAQGDVEGATDRLDAIQVEIKSLSNPVLSCMYHEAHARIAVLGNDLRSFEEHSSEVAHAVNPTRNPALIATSERLRSLFGGQGASDRAGSHDIAAATVTTMGHRHMDAVDGASTACVVTGVTTDTVVAGHASANLLSGCQGPVARSARALEMLLLASGGTSGYLFVVRGSESVLAAPVYGDPPPHVAEQVARLLAARTEAASMGFTQTTAREWHLMMLAAHIGSSERVIGVLAIEPGGITYRAPDPGLVRQLSRELYEAGDATAIQSRTSD